MKSRLLGAICACVLVHITNTSYAALEPIILDTSLNIYWVGAGNSLEVYKLTDARISEIIADVGSVDGHDLTAADFDFNGYFTWWGAMAWADQLDYGGFDNWRLPNMDINGDGIVVDCDVATEEECRDNEYGYLYQYNGVSAAFPGVFARAEGRNWSLTESGTDRAWFFGLFNTTGTTHINFTDTKSNFHRAFAVRDVATTSTPLLVSIDIKPSNKSDVNVINLDKDNNINVAIVGGAFDALQVNPDTTKFGPIGASPIRSKVQDYNRDGYSDLILTFNLSETGIDCNVNSATLTGQTIPDSVNIIGSDSFTVEPCP